MDHYTLTQMQRLAAKMRRAQRIAERGANNPTEFGTVWDYTRPRADTGIPELAAFEYSIDGVHVVEYVS